MQIFQNRFVYAVVLILSASCQSNANSLSEGEERSIQDQIVTVDGIHKGKPCFSVNLPAEMMNKYELNEDASLQYSDVHMEDQEDGSTMEFVHYVLVLMEDKDEIKANHADIGLDLKAYNTLVIENFEEVHGDSFEILKIDSTTQDLNQLKSIKTEANLISHEYTGDFKMYYKIAVLEGQNAYYQLFTWCLEEQRPTYETKMEAIILSFKEL